MVVPVPFVGRVPVPVVHVVGVIAVRHGNVTAVWPVLVGVRCMRNVTGFRALVHVVTVRVVDMAVMCVISVIAMRNRHVTTALPVGVLVASVRRMLKRVRHQTRPPCARVRPGINILRLMHARAGLPWLVCPASGAALQRGEESR